MEWNVNLDSKSSVHVRNTGIGVYSDCYCDPSVTVCRGTQVALTEYPACCSPAVCKGFDDRVISPRVHLLFEYSWLVKRMRQGQSAVSAHPPKGAAEGTEKSSSQGGKPSKGPGIRFQQDYLPNSLREVLRRRHGSSVVCSVRPGFPSKWVLS